MLLNCGIPFRRFRRILHPFEGFEQIGIVDVHLYYYTKTPCPTDEALNEKTAPTYVSAVRLKVRPFVTFSTAFQFLLANRAGLREGETCKPRLGDEIAADAAHAVGAIGDPPQGILNFIEGLPGLVELRDRVEPHRLA